MHATIQNDEVIAFTQDLVRQPSLTGEEAGAAAVVRGKMEALDYDEVRVDEYGNVIAVRHGERPGPRLLFDAHLDVVPANNPQAWGSNPFGGELRDGKIWGRGATDIKGGLAGIVIGLGRMPRQDIAGTLIVSASIGEEQIEGIALEQVVKSTQPDFALICEPSDCQLGVGQKGRTEFWIQASGRPAHTSRPELGDNAIYRALSIVGALRRLRPPDDSLLGPGVMELVEIVSEPFPGECTVPYGCRLRYDRRLASGETRQSVRDEIYSALKGLDQWETGYQTANLVTYTGLRLEKEQFHAGWAMDPASAWLRKAEQGLRQAGIQPHRIAVPYCTNGSYSAGEAGLPTLIFGPSSIRLAHVVDEYIEVEELLRGMRGLVALAAALGRQD